MLGTKYFLRPDGACITRRSQGVGIWSRRDLFSWDALKDGVMIWHLIYIREFQVDCWGMASCVYLSGGGVLGVQLGEKYVGTRLTWGFGRGDYQCKVQLVIWTRKISGKFGNGHLCLVRTDYPPHPPFTTSISYKTDRSLRRALAL